MSFSDESFGGTGGRREPPRPCPPGCQVVANVSWAFDAAPLSARPPGADPKAEFTIQQFIEKTASAAVEWFWPGRIPLGKLTLLVGDPGVGKSLLALELAARVTRGVPWPDALSPGEYGPPPRRPVGGVLLLSAEDDVADTIRPRLERAGARLEWVETLWGLSGRDSPNGYTTRTWQRPLVLPDDVQAIERTLIERPQDGFEPHPDSPIPWYPPIRLLVIDPLPAYFPAGIGNDNVQVRRMLQPLSDLAARYRMAIVGVTHLNKSIGQPGQYRTLGSVAFTAAARAVWGLTHDPHDPDRRLLLPIKNNLGPPRGGLAFRIRDAKIEWEPGEVAAEWKDAVAKSPRSSSRSRSSRSRGSDDQGGYEAVARWLVESLEGGERPAKEMWQLARQRGFGRKTVNRAKKALCVNSRKAGSFEKSGWYWRLPGDESPQGEAAQQVRGSFDENRQI